MARAQRVCRTTTSWSTTNSRSRRAGGQSTPGRRGTAHPRSRGAAAPPAAGAPRRTPPLPARIPSDRRTLPGCTAWCDPITAQEEAAMARSKRSPAKVRPGKSLTGKQARQLDDTNATAESLPFNANKATEYGREHATVPLQGQHAAPPSDLVGASSLAEANSSGKTGRPAAAGDDLTVGPLDRLRVDATGQPLSTNQGVLVAGPPCSRISSCARSRPSSCAFPPWRASADPRTPPATCGDLP